MASVKNIFAGRIVSELQKYLKDRGVQLIARKLNFYNCALQRLKSGWSLILTAYLKIRQKLLENKLKTHDKVKLSNPAENIGSPNLSQLPNITVVDL